MAKLVDALFSKTSPDRGAGSNPVGNVNNNLQVVVNIVSSYGVMATQRFRKSLISVRFRVGAYGVYCN